MCQNKTDSQTPLSGAWAKVQGQATAQLQLSNQSPVICQYGTSFIPNSSIRHSCRPLLKEGSIDLRLRPDQRHLAFTALRSRPPSQQQIEFFFPPNKSSQAGRVQSLEPAFYGRHSEY